MEQRLRPRRIDALGPGLWPLAILCLVSAPAAAQPNAHDVPANTVADADLPLFGMEFELRGRGHRTLAWGDQSYANFERILRAVVIEFGGDPSKIRKVSWEVVVPSGPRTLVRAEYVDANGGLWKVVPEYVDTRAPDGYELVTPPLDDPAKIRRIVRAVKTVSAEGIKSSVHVHVDGKGLIGPNGDATAMINLINLHERYEPLLRRLFNQQRGAGLYNRDARVGVEGAYMNRFNRPLYADHPELLAELAALPEGERTQKRVEALFRGRVEAEARAHGITELDASSWKKMWKYRSLNLANALAINEALPNKSGTVEFRMNDLDLTNPEAHRRQVEFYRALVVRAKALAAEGKLVAAPTHRIVPRGENPAEFLTAVDPAKAAEDVRAMVREVGLDPAAFEPLIGRNVRPPPVLSEGAFARRVLELNVDSAEFRVRTDATRVAGEAGLTAAIRALRASEGGPLPKVEVLVRVPAASLDLAMESAVRLVEGANLSGRLLAIGHESARGPVRAPPTVEVARDADGVKLLINPRGRTLAAVEELARVLSDGIRTAVATDRVGVRGGGRPVTVGTLAEHAARYAGEAEGKTLSAEAVRAIDAIERAGGRDLLLPLANWGEHTLARASLRDLRFRQDVYLREAIAAAEGPPGEALIRVRTALRNWAKETSLGRQLHRSLLRTGFEASLDAANEAARASLDKYAKYRRADGTLEWKKLTRDRALSEAGGVAHFALALFLKELAMVAKTGDRARVDEFFEGLLTTDFYANYGLFVLGARAGEVAYSRYLQRFVKPGFVGGILKTNLILATGLALPELVHGRFSGKAFAISLGSLGLSTTAVRAGVAGIKWVTDLRKARGTGTLARVGAATSRLAKAGGWIYSVAELAVILFVAEEIETRVNAYLDLREARDALAGAGRTFFAAAGEEDATPESVRAAADAYHAAWGDYRNFLYRPLLADEAVFAGRVKRAAREAKLGADKRRVALERVEKFPALRASIVRRYGSLQAYADELVREDEAEVQADLEKYAESYQRNRTAHLADVYEGNRRGAPFLAGLDDAPWLLGGARPGGLWDPTNGRTDFYAVFTRRRAESGLGDVLRSASRNRLEAYDDEAEVLAAVVALLRQRGRSGAADAVAETRDLTLRTRAIDADLAGGKGIAALGAAGASDHVGRDRN